MNKSLPLGAVLVLMLGAGAALRWLVVPGPWQIGRAPPPAQTLEESPTYRSRVVLPIAVSHARLASLIEEALPPTFVESKPDRVSVGGISIPVQTTVTVSRGGSVQIQQVDEWLMASLDLAVTAQVKNRGGIVRFSETARGALRVHVRVRLAEGTEGAPRAEVAADYEWLQRPSGDVFGLFPYSVGSAAGEQVVKALRALEETAEARLTEALVSADRLEQALQPRTLGLPLPSADGQLAWVQIVPERLQVSPLRAAEGRSVVLLGVERMATVAVEEMPQAAPASVSLLSVAGLEPGFDLVVPIVLPLSRLAEELRTELAARLASNSAVKLEVASVVLFGAQDGLGLSLELRGDFGTLLGSSTLIVHSEVEVRFDEETSSLQVSVRPPDLDDLEWPVSLLAARALGELPEGAMQVGVSLGNRLDVLNLTLGQMLSSLSNDELAVSARVERVSIERISTSEESLVIVARAVGVAAVDVL